MGRLGFNLVRHKEASKNVEAGVVAADQQNERNEHVEIGELILVIEKSHRHIKNLKFLAIILTGLVILLSGLLIFQTKIFHDEQKEAAETQAMLEQTLRIETMQSAFSALQAETLEQQQNCTVQDTDLQLELEAERSRRDAESLESRRRYEALHASFETLQKKHEELGNQSREAQEELKTELRKLGDERADLERKLTEANRRLERKSSQARQAKTSPAPTTTSTAVPPTTTAASTTTTRGGIFDSERFKKINDLVKDIETGAAIFDFREFMKKTDEVFRF